MKNIALRILTFGREKPGEVNDLLVFFSASFVYSDHIILISLKQYNRTTTEALRS